jgi:hypothetical protein
MPQQSCFYPGNRRLNVLICGGLFSWEELLTFLLPGLYLKCGKFVAECISSCPLQSFQNVWAKSYIWDLLGYGRGIACGGSE